MKLSGLSKVLIRSILLIAFSLLFLFPFYIALTNAVKTYEDVIKNPLSLPVHMTLENFKLAFERSDIGSLYINTTVITAVSVALLILTGSMASYIISRRDKKIYKVLYVIFLGGIMVPGPVVLIPSLMTLNRLHLLNTLPGLFFFYAGTYMSIVLFLYVEFVKTIPVSMEESAVIDGASQYTIFFRIIFPLLKPCTATAVIFLGMWIWNDFLSPMYILGSNRGRTITTGVYGAIGRYTSEWNIAFACVILASAPILVLYLLMQKQFIKGLTAGAVKG